jgi:putative Holliday junction resolvase
MRTGVRIGVDVGTVRVGIARSDRDGLLATPIETLNRDDQTLARVIELVGELDCMECYIGLPLSLSGTQTLSTENAVAFARELSTAMSIPVRLIDERLTTVSAHAALRQSGKQASRSRSVVDQVAAVMLLQHALDTERARGDAPGIGVDDYN